MANDGFMWILGLGILAVGVAGFIYLQPRGANSPDFAQQIQNKILSPLGIKSSNYGTYNTMPYGEF